MLLHFDDTLHVIAAPEKINIIKIELYMLLQRRHYKYYKYDIFEFIYLYGFSPKSGV